MTTFLFYFLGLGCFCLFLLNSLPLSFLPLGFGLDEIAIEPDFLAEVHILGEGDGYHEGGSALRPFAVVSVDLGSSFLCAVLEVLEQLNGVFGGEVFVDPLPVDLDHGSVGAGAQALDFLDGEHVVGGGLPIFDSEMFLAGGDDIFGASELAGGGSADL